MRRRASLHTDQSFRSPRPLASTCTASKRPVRRSADDYSAAGRGGEDLLARVGPNSTSGALLRAARAKLRFAGGTAETLSGGGGAGAVEPALYRLVDDGAAVPGAARHLACRRRDRQ